MTDEILLNEMMSDYFLKEYSIIVIDEAHERKLPTDILIGLLSKLVNERAEMTLDQYNVRKNLEDVKIFPLRLIIMSATMKIDDFKKNTIFEKPPLIKIQSKTFPVNIFYNKITPVDYLNDIENKI